LRGGRPEEARSELDEEGRSVERGLLDELDETVTQEVLSGRRGRIDPQARSEDLDRARSTPAP
jgi:hypothetical protein